jgi:N-acetyl-1-D-myo-inositol-2-amino-2-deoxy-alpha-D-glucopyranoside deacetylase
MAALSCLTALAAEAGAAPVPVAYCILTPQSWASADRAWLRDNVVLNEVVAEAGSHVPQQDAPYPPSVVSDVTVTHVIEEPALVEVQSRALAQHRSQVSVYEGYYALSNHIAIRLAGREGFARFDPVAGHLLPAAPGAPRHTGLLSDLPQLEERKLLDEPTLLDEPRGSA